MYTLLGDDAEAHAQRLVHVFNQLKSFGKEGSEEGLADALRDGGLAEKVDPYVLRPLMRELGVKCGNICGNERPRLPQACGLGARACQPASLRPEG